MSLPPNYSLLAKHPNKYFIETGSYRGDAIQQAMDVGCFHEIRSIDIDPENIEFCKSRFFGRLQVPLIKLYTGNSATELWKMIEDIKEPITFWLDAHSQLFEDEPPMDDPFPLLKELEQIAKHPVKTHTIIVDDLLVLTHPDVTGWSLADLHCAIYDINLDYRFERIANPVKNNILLAKI